MDAHQKTAGVMLGTLLASGATLVCCVLPAVLVSVGAGATLIGLISAFPQLVWLSEHKPVVFGSAAVLLVIGGLMLRRARRLPCPVDPVAARSCLRLRRVSDILYLVALIAFSIGALFAFVLPRLNR
jgi:hypothetical protein